MFFIAGPCLAESKEIVFTTAEKLASIFQNFPDTEFIFKASYRKANRSSINSFTGVGNEIALSWIREVGEKYNVKTITDIHSVEEAALAAKYVDILQIPAFLARQTELIIAAAETGKTVNIKKGQFMAPSDMQKAIKKVESTGNKKITLTERGTFFGYHDLVVDYRSLLKMKEYGYPVIYDATHSVQQPSIGEISGGLRQYTKQLAYAAAACNVDGIFLETHPNPDKALCDATTQLPLDEVEDFITNILKVNAVISSIDN